MYYFAYGSNMSKERIEARLSYCKSLGVYCLPEYQFKCHKVGSDGSAKGDALYTNSGHKMYGVLYELSPADKLLLDDIEGVGKGYECREVKVYSGLNKTGVGQLAYLYAATETDETLKPFGWYMHHIIFGAKQANLPHQYVSKFNLIPCQNDPDASRAAREMAIYNV